MARIKALVTTALLFSWERKGQLEELREPHPPPEGGGKSGYPASKPALGFHQTAPTPSAARIPTRSEGCSFRALPRARQSVSSASPSGLATPPRVTGRFWPVTSERSRVNPGAPEPACTFTPRRGARPAYGLAPREGDAPGLRRPPPSERLAPGISPPHGASARTAAALGCHVAQSPPGTEMLSRTLGAPPEPGRPPTLGPPRLSALTQLPDPLTELPKGGRGDDGGGSSARAGAAGWPT